MRVIIAITCSPEQLKRPVLTAGNRPFVQQPMKNKRIIKIGVMRIFGLMITVVVELCQQSRFSDSLPMQFSAYSTLLIFVYVLHFMGCILHTTNIELRPRLVSLGRFFCSILLGYSLLGISPKPFNLFYCSGCFYEKRPNRSDCLPNYNCAIPTCYIRPCLNWCKIGVIHSAAIPSKYRFPRHYSGLVGSLCIFNAFKYTRSPRSAIGPLDIQ